MGYRLKNGMTYAAGLALLIFFLVSCGTTESAPPPVFSEPVQESVAESVPEPVPVPPAAASAPVPQPVPVRPAPVIRPEPQTRLPIPRITASPYQETVYNGSPQSITARCDQDIPLVITYYRNREDYITIQNGFYDSPAEPGLYYISVNCAPGYGYAYIDDMLVEFRIKKAPVKIIADETQNAVFNGNPRRVQAAAEPVVPLSYSYYPNPLLRRAALEDFLLPDTGQSSLATALHGFTRVESAPIEQGIYYVLVYFNGDDRYEKTYKEIEFTINPAVRRN